MSSNLTPEIMLLYMESPEFEDKIEEIVKKRLADILTSPEGWAMFVGKIQHAYDIGHLSFPPTDK